MIAIAHSIAADWSVLGRPGDEIDFLERYREIGLAIVLLHGLTERGECTCGRGLDCQPSQFGKHPLWPGYLDDSPRWADMRRELVRSRRRNLALRLGDQPSGLRLVALDVDGADSLLDPIVRRFGPLPVTLTERSGRGSHWVYRLPAEVRYPVNQAIASGVEIKSLRGKFTAPPSLHAAGHRRQWTIAIEPAELPRALAEAIQRPPERPPTVLGALNMSGIEATPYGARALQVECRAIADAREGERNAQLNRSAFSVFQLVFGGEIPEAEAEAELLRAALSTGMKEREARATIESARKGGMRKPRTAPLREQQRGQVG